MNILIRLKRRPKNREHQVSLHLNISPQKTWKRRSLISFNFLRNSLVRRRGGIFIRVLIKHKRIKALNKQILKFTFGEGGGCIQICVARGIISEINWPKINVFWRTKSPSWSLSEGRSRIKTRKGRRLIIVFFYINSANDLNILLCVSAERDVTLINIKISLASIYIFDIFDHDTSKRRRRREWDLAQQKNRNNVAFQAKFLKFIATFIFFFSSPSHALFGVTLICWMLLDLLSDSEDSIRSLRSRFATREYFGSAPCVCLFRWKRDSYSSNH